MPKIYTMRRYILIVEDLLKELEKDYLTYDFYFDTQDEAKAAAKKLSCKTWLMNTVQYIYYVNHKIYGAKASILWQNTK